MENIRKIFLLNSYEYMHNYKKHRSGAEFVIMS